MSASTPTQAVSPAWTRHLVIAWVLLVALTLAGPALGSTGLLLAIAGVKFTLIGLVFMELRHAHVLWRVLLVGFALFVAAFCAIAL